MIDACINQQYFYSLTFHDGQKVECYVQQELLHDDLLKLVLHVVLEQRGQLDEKGLVLHDEWEQGDELG